MPSPGAGPRFRPQQDTILEDTAFQDNQWQQGKRDGVQGIWPALRQAGPFLRYLNRPLPGYWKWIFSSQLTGTTLACMGGGRDGAVASACVFVGVAFTWVGESVQSYQARREESQ